MVSGRQQQLGQVAGQTDLERAGDRVTDGRRDAEVHLGHERADRVGEHRPLETSRGTQVRFCLPACKPEHLSARGILPPMLEGGKANHDVLNNVIGAVKTYYSAHGEFN